MAIADVYGLPGVRAAKYAENRVVLRQGDYTFLSGPITVNGTLSRDSGNTGYEHVLRPGLLMGKITSTGLYAPSIIGVMTAAASATDTTVTVSAAQAAELVRRVGATGTLRLVGPPSAAGTVATFTETYSAVNTTTGDITVSGLDANLIEGSFVVANDGSYLPLTFIPEIQNGGGDWSLRVTDQEGDSVNVPFIPPIAGIIDSSQLIDWPSDTSLQEWIFDNLNGTGSGSAGGKFVGDHYYL